MTGGIWPTISLKCIWKSCIHHPNKPHPEHPPHPRQLFQHPTLSSSPLPVPHPVVPSLNVARRWVVPPGGWCPPHRGKLQPNSTLKFPGTLNEEGSLQPNAAIGCFFLTPTYAEAKSCVDIKLHDLRCLQWQSTWICTQFPLLLRLQNGTPTQVIRIRDRPQASIMLSYCEESSLFPWWLFIPFNQKQHKKRRFAWPFSSIFPMLGDFPSLLVFSLRKSPNQPKTRSANANTSSSKAKSLYHIATIPYTTVIVEFKWTLRAFDSMIQLKKIWQLKEILYFNFQLVVSWLVPPPQK